MKDQYVGDVSDYLKYAMLRAWSARGLSVALGWMRTEPDVRSDGGLIRYLGRPERYRELDPELFDGLARLVATDQRSVRNVVELELIAGSFSYEALLQDDHEARDAWFAGLARGAKEAQIMFLDPDNGLEVATVPRGRAGSRRYVYLEELRTVRVPGQAIVVYQHFPRVVRETYLNVQLRRLTEVWPGALTFAVCSPRIALLLSVPSALSDTMFEAARALVDGDTGGVGVRIYVPTMSK